MRLCGNNERSHSFTSASLIGAHFFIFLDTISGGHNMKQKFLVVLFIFSIISTFVSCGDKDHDTLSVVSEEMVFSEISWPDNEFTNLIPTPKSKMGNISSDSSYGFFVYINDTTKEDYDAYVNECQNKGFTVDYNKGDDYFWADNEIGYRLQVRYKGDNIMFIRIEPPKDETEEVSSAPLEETSKETSDNSNNENEIVSENTDSENINDILTIENCSELSEILSLKDPADQRIKIFADKYSGKKIKFDANILYVGNHETYKTRYDISISAGDYSETSLVGPNFQFVDVNVSNLGIKDLYLPDYIAMGNNICVIAEVKGYDDTTQIFELTPIEVTQR